MSVPAGLAAVEDHGIFARIRMQFAAGIATLRRASRGYPRRMQNNAIAVRAGVAIAATLIVAVLFDASAITAARRLPLWLIDIFDTLTDFGKSGWFLWPLAAVMLAIAAAPARLPRMTRLVLASIAMRAAFLFLAIGLPGLFTTIVKRWIGRARPFVGGSADPYLFHPFGWKVEYASLPSGHAVTAVAAAIAFGMLWPRLRPLMWTYAVTICISRVVLTAHHPSDVLAGAFVGIVGVLMVRHYFAARRILFGVSSSGAVMAFPGPSKRHIKSVARAMLAD